MKKFKLLSLALAALALGACSSSDDVAEGGGGNSTSYVTVNIRTVSDLPGTRAGEYTQGGGTYEDGEGNESTISSVNFYFFNADGSPYLMNNGGGVTNKANSTSFTDAGSDQTQTIESMKTTLVLSGTGTPKPKYCIAIANDPLTISEPITLADLKKKVAELGSITGASGFTMSNSVYKNSSDAIVTEQDIEAAVKPTKAEAETAPVNIYIERVAAKVNTSISTAGTAWTESAGVYKIKVGKTAGGNDVFAVVKGWGVADGKKYVWMTKNLSTDYTLNFTPWNSDENNFHRSFWANTYAESDQAVVNYSWSQYTKAIGKAIYTNENTPTVAYDPATLNFYNGNKLSKVLVAAQLVDVSDNPVELCTYRGVEYLSAGDVKTQILSELKDKFRKDEGGTKKNLEATDLVFKTQKSLSPIPSGMKNYEVTVRLTSPLTLEKYDGSTWASATETDLYNVVDKAFAQIRTSGDAYYYIPISHLGDSENKLGAFGVVRNHSYKVTINDMKGFGTPVYDPNEEITPTVPNDEKVYLAAKINVLSWRVVKSNVDLDKTK